MRMKLATAFLALWTLSANAQQLYVPPFPIQNISGDLTCTSSGGCTIANNAVTLAKLATQATNTVLGNATSGTAVPTALAVGTCSTAGSALIWTTNAGFSCNTSVTAAAVPASGLTGATLASGVTASSLTTLGGGTVGTAAFKATGTSGNVVPLLDGNNIWSGSQALSAVGPSWNMNKAASGTNNTIFGSTNNQTRWAVNIGDSAAESGSNAGSNFSLYNYTDASAIIGTAFSVTRSTGAVQMPQLASSSAAQTGTLCWTTGTGNITVDTTTTCLLSGREFKRDIRPIDNADSLKTVLALKPSAYFYIDPMIPDEQIGLIADEVERADPRLIARKPDGTPRAVRYQQLTADLAGAIQAQQKQIEELRARRWCLAGLCW